MNDTNTALHNNNNNNYNITDSIVRVVDNKNNFYGTAFFLHSKYCVTCHRCVCEIEDQICIQKGNKKYDVEWVKEYSDMNMDIAILINNDSATTTTTTTPAVSFKPLGSAEIVNSLAPSSFFIWTFMPNKINNDSSINIVPVKNEVEKIHLHYQLTKEAEEGRGQEQTKSVIKKEEWNKKPRIEVGNVDVYRIPGKKLDITYSGSPVCYSDNNSTIVIGMIADNEDENYYVSSIPMHIILNKFEVNDVTEWMQKGFLLYESGEVQKAIECYNNALKINPNNSNAWLLKAEAIYNLDDYQRAHGCYMRVLELLNPNTQVYQEASVKRYYCYELAWDQAGINYYEEYSKVNKEEPPRGSRAWVSKKSWHRKGLDLYNLGEYGKAIECYNKAIELDCNDIGAWNGKGIALYFLGEYEKAIECYSHALQLTSDHVDIYINKGFALRKLGDSQQAIMYFNKARAINPKV